MATTILTKRSNTASAVPLAADLTNSSSGSELAVNTADKRLFTKDSGGTVVELGINPSSLTLSGGTANGVLYLNGSKVATSGSALTFDGSKLGIGGTAVQKLSVLGSVSNFHLNPDSTGNVYAYAYNDAGAAYTAIRLDASYHAFLTSGTEQMRLTSTGLGIGTSSPAYKLDVSKSATGLLARFTGLNNAVAIYTDSTLGGFSDSTGQYGLFNVYSGGSATATTIWTANAERMRLDSSGNLGLGVTPSAWSLGGLSAMQIRNGGFYGYDVTEVGVAGNCYYNSGWKYIATGASTRATQVNGQHLWYTAASGTAGNAITFTQAMTLTSGGELMIGQTSVGLQNKNSLFLEAGTGAYLANHASGTSSGTVYAYFGYNASNIGSITQNGTTAVAYNTSSDYRLKNTIAPMTGALAKVAQLKPVTYKWNADGSDGEGFIAHELAEVVPQCVTGEKDAVDEDGNPQYQGIDTSFLVATLTAAIQELKAEFDAYKASHP